MPQVKGLKELMLPVRQQREKADTPRLTFCWCAAYLLFFPGALS